MFDAGGNEQCQTPRREIAPIGGARVAIGQRARAAFVGNTVPNRLQRIDAEMQQTQPLALMHHAGWPQTRPQCQRVERGG